MNEIKKILVVEDDLSILEGLKDNLIAEGYFVFTTSNGLDGLDMAKEEMIDLLILDIMLPGINGFEICKKIKIKKPLLPILMLTARSAEMDKIAGLDYGADDYMTKPFSISELLARVRAILRRSYSQNKIIEEFTFGKVKVNFIKMQAFVKKKEVKFTTKEFAIMEYFIHRSGEVIHRHELLNKVWGYKSIPTTRTVDNFILDIRKKIEDSPSNPKHIVSVSGIGYRFEP